MDIPVRADLTDLVLIADDIELEAAGGCGACGLEAGQMCAACGQCNCDDHGQCTRPAAGHVTPPRVRVCEGITWTCEPDGPAWTAPAGDGAARLAHGITSGLHGWSLALPGRGRAAYLGATLWEAMEDAAPLL